GFLDSYPNNLSGGMRQRVALIRTLALKPDILLLDEPFSALDYQTRLAVSDDVFKIIKDTGKTVIMITHDIAEAISMADRVVVLTDRPSKVKKIYQIEMEEKSNPINNRKCKEFSKYYDMIWKEIDYHDK
ncbi:MAG: ATP-binding cassette domain-containing protein, partial [Bacilli bacterium]